MICVTFCKSDSCSSNPAQTIACIADAALGRGRCPCPGVRKQYLSPVGDVHQATSGVIEKCSPRTNNAHAFSSAQRLIESGGEDSATTQDFPSRITPAFSIAISSMELPSHDSWSMAICVITLTSGSTIFIASRRPPSPISSTATSTLRSRKTSSAASVENSK